jgi:AcrR family transcriptional regulator
MSEEEIGPPLRERKAAATRRALADALQAALRNAPLSEIRVDDVAAAATVSRMTFFNYFASKEVAVAWIYAAWLYGLQLALHRGATRGLAAILRMTRHFATELESELGGLRRIFTSWELSDHFAALPELTEADRRLIAPDLRDFPGQMSYGQMLTRATHEALQAGELSYEGTPYEFSLYVGALIHGTLLTGPPDLASDHPRLLLRHVHRALGLPLDDAAPPPDVPQRYRYHPEPVSAS